MPMRPRTAMANPTLRGGIPRPPVKPKGRNCRVWEGGDGFCGSNRGAERWMNQRLLKVPRWRAKIEWQRRVQRTLRVQMRENGSFRLGVGFWAGGLGRRDSNS